MLVWLLAIALHIVPPLMSVLIYERLRGRTQKVQKRVARFLFFMISTIIAGYVVMWLRGWVYHEWLVLELESAIGILKIMIIPFVSAAVVPFVIYLIKDKDLPNEEGKSNKDNLHETKTGKQEKVNSLRSYIPQKAYLVATVAISFTISFTVFLLAPLELYFYNAPVFLVSWRFLFPTFLVSSFVMFTILQIVLLFIWYLMVKLEISTDLVLLVIWGVIVASYVQMLFLNGRMTLVTGGLTEYGTLNLKNLSNLVLWILIAITPFCLWAVFILKKKEFKYIKVLIVTLVLICCMQIAGVISSSRTSKEFIGIDEDIPKIPTYEATTRLSNKNNIIVFIIDSFDVLVMRDVLEEYPELKDQLDGFTFYENNVSEYFNTFPSVTTMLTQHYYSEEMTFQKYFNEAWGKHLFIDDLRDNGFSTSVYLDMPATYGNLENIADRTDNLEDDLQIIADYEGIFKVAGLTSLGRAAPYMLKDNFLTQLGFTISDHLMSTEIAGYDDSEIFSLGITLSGDFNFFTYIKQNELTTSNRKVFLMYHLIGSHQPFNREITTHEQGYHFDDASGTLEIGGNYIDSTRACLMLLITYFQKMKELGVYDNSTIILLGDHGRQRTQEDIDDLSRAITTAVLVKPRDATGELMTDSFFEFSHKYFGASIMDAADLPHSEYGVSYNDIIGGLPPPVRVKYDYNNWWQERETTQYIRLNGVYEISGDANDFSNWVFIPNNG